MATPATAPGLGKSRFSHHKGQISVQQACRPAPSQINCDREEREKYVFFLQETERKNSRLMEKLEREFGKVYALCRETGWTDVLEELEECKKTLQDEECDEKRTLQMKLLKIQNGVKRFKNYQTMEPCPVVAERLKKQMSEVEVSINNLKEEHRSCMIEIIREEWLCLKEIAAFENKFKNWSLPVKPIPKLTTAPTATSAPTLKSKPQERALPAEVRALDAFLQKTGGLYGGWEEYDHRDFARAWKKHSGKTPYRDEAKLYLPGKTMKDIVQHENWYQELLCLQEKKKEAIQRWKAHKHQEHQTRIQTEKKKEEEMQKKEKEINSVMTDKDREMVALKLENWRLLKKEKEEEEMQQRRENKIEEKKRGQAKLLLHLKVKQNNAKRLQLRREAEEEQARRKREAEEREMNKRGREATKAIKCLTERDIHKMKQKLHEKQLREEEEEQRQRRAAAMLKDKVDGHVTRDPSRLICPTKGWEERMKHIGPSGVGRVLQMFHRAIPTWRQGL